MPSKSKRKGTGFEREVVKFFKDRGIDAKRAYASNGESLGLAKEVDVLLKGRAWDLKLQCKRLKKFPKYLGLCDAVDGVIFREDNGNSYVLTNTLYLAILLNILNGARPDDTREIHKAK